jgi:predicted RNA-binding protein YlxR (DUF448 family)
MCVRVRCRLTPCSSRAQGEHAHAYRAALLAAVAGAEDADVVAAALHEQRRAQEGLLLAAWTSAIARVATRQANQAARVAERAASRAQLPARKVNASVRKPRQGYSKPVMRLLTVRMCCACRALVPRDLMWRVMQLRPPPPPGTPPKPQPRRRKVRRRWVYARKRRSGEQAGAVVAAAEGGAAEQPAAAAAAQEDHLAANAENAPSGPGKNQAQKRGGGGTAAVPGALAERRGVRVLLQRLGAGAASAELQADGELWSPPRRSVRSAYVCRKLPCVQAAVKRKARARACTCVLCVSCSYATPGR